MKALLAVFLGVLVGCGGNGSSSAPVAAARVCEPGRQLECPCPGGTMGAQACKDDGAGYAACVCPDAGGSGGSGGASSADAEPSGPCDGTGTFLLALSLKELPSKPILFTAQVGVGGIPSASLVALSTADHQTPVGNAQHFPSLTVAADANPITPGSDMTLEAMLAGITCVDGLTCGDVTGSASKPIPIADLSGSTFTLEPVASAAKHTPYIDCAKHHAVF